MKNSNTSKILLLAIILCLTISGCADVVQIDECVTDDPYGFWGGLWHGIISPISFIGSLLDKDIALYAINNNGGWYDLGFVIGAGILFGSSGRKSK